MSIGAPVGSDWMCTAKPMASKESSACWARWLPTTVKRVRWGVLSWIRPRASAVVRLTRRGWFFAAKRAWGRGSLLEFWMSIGKVGFLGG